MQKLQSLRRLSLRVRRAQLILLWMIIVAGAFVILTYARPAIRFILDVLSPFIVAMIVAYIFNPLVGFLQQRLHVGRIKGVIITYALILLITAGFFCVVLPILYFQLRLGLQHASERLPGIIDSTLEWLNRKFPDQEIGRIREDFRNGKLDWNNIRQTAGPAAAAVAEQLQSMATLITRWVGTAAAWMLGFFAFVSFVIVITFYFLLDYANFEYVARVLLPDDREARVFQVWSRIDYALGGFLRGQLIVAMIVGVLYSIALMLLGMKPYAILIGFLAGFGNLIPYFGPIAGGVPAGLWVIFGDRFATIEGKIIGVGLVILISVLIQSIDGFFLQPRIVGKNAGLHPLLVLLALIIGGQFGLGGLVLAVPLAVVAKSVIKEIWWDPLARSEAAKGVLPAGGQ
jgi:predicted PurR-regulated permease PerM